MQTPDQVKYLKELMLAYNGDAPDYENIEAVMIDAGSGGGGVNIADYLMEDWIDDKGVTHRGLIDKEYLFIFNYTYLHREYNKKRANKLIRPSIYDLRLWRYFKVNTLRLHIVCIIPRSAR